MTEDRASELIHRLKKLYYIPDLLLEDDIKRITDCIERQIPKKPIDYRGVYLKCVCCGSLMHFHYRNNLNDNYYNYCPKCGQRLTGKE